MTPNFVPGHPAHSTYSRQYASWIARPAVSLGCHSDHPGIVHLIKSITDDALNILMNYSYQGNIRELENIIEHAISFANSPEILPADLPSYLLQSPSKKATSASKLREALADLEKDLICSALQKSGWNISQAAAALGMYRQQLQRKIKQLQIAP